VSEEGDAGMIERWSFSFYLAYGNLAQSLSQLTGYVGVWELTCSPLQSFFVCACCLAFPIPAADSPHSTAAMHIIIVLASATKDTIM
jgi:hypothetical protein